MTNKQFRSLARGLSADLPGFAVKPPIMFALPITHTLRGVCFESHSHDTNLFYVWVFFLPLFVPRTYLSLEFGERIDGDSGPGEPMWQA